LKFDSHFFCSTLETAYVSDILGQPKYVLLLNIHSLLVYPREKRPIEGEKCYKIFDTFNTLSSPTAGGTKKIN